MKAGREHRVPLSEPALAVLAQMKSIRQNEYIFPGDRRACLSNMALLMALRRMKREDITQHGFRATFRTWAAERNHFAREVVEAALAHTIGNRVEADVFDKRRRLMDAWANFFAKDTSTAEILPLRKG